MNTKLICSLLVLCLAINLVSSQVMPCPRKCQHPRNKADCIACLNEGYSDVVDGKPGVFMGHRNLWTKLEKGSHIEWSENRCWILIKGIKDKDQCHEIGPYIFGQGRCSGFEKASYKVFTSKCWAKFRP